MLAFVHCPQAVRSHHHSFVDNWEFAHIFQHKAFKSEMCKRGTLLRTFQFATSSATALLCSVSFHTAEQSANRAGLQIWKERVLYLLTFSEKKVCRFPYRIHSLVLGEPQSKGRHVRILVGPHTDRRGTLLRHTPV